MWLSPFCPALIAKLDESSFIPHHLEIPGVVAVFDHFSEWSSATDAVNFDPLHSSPLAFSWAAWQTSFSRIVSPISAPAFAASAVAESGTGAGTVTGAPTVAEAGAGTPAATVATAPAAATPAAPAAVDT